MTYYRTSTNKKILCGGSFEYRFLKIQSIFLVETFKREMQKECTMDTATNDPEKRHTSGKGYHHGHKPSESMNSCIIHSS